MMRDLWRRLDSRPADILFEVIADHEALTAETATRVTYGSTSEYAGCSSLIDPTKSKIGRKTSIHSPRSPDYDSLDQSLLHRHSVATRRRE
jgi:ribonucleotide reductase alpha subunit